MPLGPSLAVLLSGWDQLTFFPALSKFLLLQFIDKQTYHLHSFVCSQSSGPPAATSLWPRPCSAYPKAPNTVETSYRAHIPYFGASIVYF